MTATSNGAPAKSAQRAVREAEPQADADTDGAYRAAGNRDRIEGRDLGAGCDEIVSRHGFVERPNPPRLRASLEGQPGPPGQLCDWHFESKRTTLFLPRDEGMPG
ncbi:hypothetical protein [Paraburkholderia sp. 2C]